MSDQPESASPSDVPFYTGAFTVPDGYPRTAANAFTKFSLVRPAVLIPLAILVVLIALSVVDVVVRRTPVSLQSVAPGIALVIVVVVLLVVRTNSLVRQLSVNGQPGARYILALSEVAISVRSPKSTSSVGYDYYSRLDVRGDFVFLKLRHARIRSIVPRQLFTDEMLSYVKGRIEQ